MATEINLTPTWRATAKMLVGIIENSVEATDVDFAYSEVVRMGEIIDHLLEPECPREQMMSLPDVMKHDLVTALLIAKEATIACAFTADTTLSEDEQEKTVDLLDRWLMYATDLVA